MCMHTLDMLVTTMRDRAFTWSTQAVCRSLELLGRKLQRTTKLMNTSHKV